MEKHPSESAITRDKPAAPPPDFSRAPDVRRTPWFRSAWFLSIAVGCLALAACLALTLPSLLKDRTPPMRVANNVKVGLGDEQAANRWADWTHAPATPEQRLCVQFLKFKNANDPAADGLLGPTPAVPAAPVTREEAERLQTDFFLRQDFRVVGTGRDGPTGALVLYTKGNMSVPTLGVKTGDGVEAAQRTMTNPDLLIEVRDGRIHGVAARLHL